MTDTITEYRNELGQTVYSVAASHFDISPPLLEMAVASEPEQADESSSRRPIRRCRPGASSAPISPIRSSSA